MNPVYLICLPYNDIKECAIPLLNIILLYLLSLLILGLLAKKVVNSVSATHRRHPKPSNASNHEKSISETTDLAVQHNQHFSASISDEHFVAYQGLIRAGLCPTDISRLIQKGEDIGKVFQLYLYLDLQYYRYHTHCDADHCELLNPFDKKDYRWTHSYPCQLTEECESQMLQSPMHEITINLQTNQKFHVLGMSRSSLTQSEPFQLVDGMSVKFIAISHVWQHGMGNWLDNALPACMVSKLLVYLEPFFGGEGSQVYFWLDTLCVPIHSISWTEAREKAINQMASIYRRADRVLVLDLDLMDSPCLGILEAVLRISCSDWSKRLWTCYEHELACNLSFQFQNTRIDTNTSVLKDWYGHSVTTQEYICRTLGEFAMKIEDGKLVKLSTQGIERLRDIPRLLSHRSTTHARDEVICMAGIVGLNGTQIHELQKSHDVDAMRKFWHFCVKVPLTTPFTPSRHRTPGWRWIPESFLIGKTEIVSKTLDEKGSDLDQLSDRSWATTSYCGLRIQCPGYILTGTYRLRQRSYQFTFVCPMREKVFRIVLDNENLRSAICDPVVIFHNSPEAVEHAARASHAAVYSCRIFLAVHRNENLTYLCGGSAEWSRDHCLPNQSRSHVFKVKDFGVKGYQTRWTIY